jgi:hypothetical protein
LRFRSRLASVAVVTACFALVAPAALVALPGCSGSGANLPDSTRTLTERFPVSSDPSYRYPLTFEPGGAVQVQWTGQAAPLVQNVDYALAREQRYFTLLRTLPPDTSLSAPVSLSVRYRPGGAVVRSFAGSFTDNNSTSGPYSLGKAFLVDQSEEIRLNGRVLRPDVDYLIDYSRGQLFLRSPVPASSRIEYAAAYWEEQR